MDPPSVITCSHEKRALFQVVECGKYDDQKSENNQDDKEWEFLYDVERRYDLIKVSWYNFSWDIL